MYTSRFDVKLEFPFDPFREYHKGNNVLQWPEYPYKQKSIDRVIQRIQGCTMLQAAGALLVGYGSEDKAETAFNLCYSLDDWGRFETRFLDERAAFAESKLKYIRDSAANLRTYMKQVASRKQLEEEVQQVAAKNATIKVIRYENGDKYEGQVHTRERVMIPHGEGTLFVREKSPIDDPLHPTTLQLRYVGLWMNGLMHGQGTYHNEDKSSWKGNFLMNEMHGRGDFRHEPEEEDDGTDPEWTPTPPLVRYYYKGRHICWGSDLVHNSRIRIYHELGSTTSARQANTHYVTTPFIEGCLANYDPNKDLHLFVVHERPDQWIQLSGMQFKLVSAHPYGPYLPPIDN